MKWLPNVCLAGLAILIALPGHAHSHIHTVKRRGNPPAIYLNGHRVTAAIDQSTNTPTSDHTRCGASTKPYRRSYRQKYYASDYPEYSCSTAPYYSHYDRPTYRDNPFSVERWAHRLNGYWETEDGWRQYEIVVRKHSIRIRRVGHYRGHTLYPDELRRRRGVFANRHGDFVEWRDGVVLWHQKGRRIIPLYRR